MNRYVQQVGRKMGAAFYHRYPARERKRHGTAITEESLPLPSPQHSVTNSRVYRRYRLPNCLNEQRVFDLLTAALDENKPILLLRLGDTDARFLTGRYRSLRKMQKTSGTWYSPEPECLVGYYITVSSLS